ncbi:MAG: cytidylate kinase family protein, partial [Desulfosarcinaceae bacterium]
MHQQGGAFGGVAVFQHSGNPVVVFDPRRPRHAGADHAHARDQHFLDCIQAALLEHARKDNIVYHGMAGHLFLSGISHVIKIRVLAEMEDRIALVGKMRGIPRKEAIAVIEAE